MYLVIYIARAYKRKAYQLSNHYFKIFQLKLKTKTLKDKLYAKFGQ